MYAVLFLLRLAKMARFLIRRG
uniref:Uncharacterized protein n=1 Tax=Rhizophora mucronata TaxID=61149 RepID=A0A2P2NT60_RHIMU